MIMPYGERDTGVAVGVGLPKVDFDALWENVYRPAIEKLDYQPVRADQDMGAVIIKDMIERLTIADLVLADITTANAYYEIGVRHAAKEKACVLLSANWAKPAFDLAQIRHVQFPLASKSPSGAEAEALCETLVPMITDCLDSASPIFDLLPGYWPAKMEGATSFSDLIGRIATFQGRVKAATRVGTKEERCTSLHALADELLASKSPIASVALELLPVIRDNCTFTDVLSYIDKLPPALQQLPFIQEQRALAQSKIGDHKQAIAALETLIELAGETAERRGLLGGRFKKLYSSTKDEQYLNDAIENYTRGMYLDLNEFYCASNLPRLLRRRGWGEDEQLAVTAAEVTRAACERQLQKDPSDPWLGQTLLGQAVDARDLATVKKLVSDIRKGKHPQWQMDTTAADLQTSLALITDAQLRSDIEAALSPLAKK